MGADVRWAGERLVGRNTCTISELVSSPEYRDEHSIEAIAGKRSSILKRKLYLFSYLLELQH